MKGGNVVLTYLVEIKRKLSRNRAVESGFEISGPVLRKDILSSCVLFTNSRYSRINAFTTVDVFDGCFSEEEQDVIADIERADKVWFWKKGDKIRIFR